MTYREYAKKNGHSDKQIENMVDGLFGADAEMRFIEEIEGGILYDMGNGYKLYAMNSTYDVCVLENGNGEEIESWNLEY